MLRVEHLRVTYGRTVAVQDVSLEVREGETVGVVGPNGAGKTSTLRAIMGLVRPDGGTVEFDGRSILGWAPDQVVRDGVAFVPAGHRVFGSMSVKDNLILGQGAAGARAREEDLGRVLEHFPVLERHYTTAAGKMSGGEQQQLTIARALLSRPRVLLLDEPSQGLAPRFVQRVFEILGDLRRDGVTLLLVEQNVARTIRFADRTYVIRSGRVELAGTQAELERQEDLARAYLGG